MNRLTLNQTEIKKWVQDRGDDTHIINHNLNQDSVVIDLGGYKGLWAKQMIKKYNPYVYIIEPINEYYHSLVDTFKDNKKVHILNVAVGIEDKDGVIYLNGDGTSTNISSNEIRNIEFKSMVTLLKMWDLKNVDLIQINIEGDEYLLLENIISNGIIDNFKNIQIQFHYGIENDTLRRETIRQGLLNKGFKEKFNYPFVWECWTK
jgi:FkbM family methyltransferase